MEQKRKVEKVWGFTVASFFGLIAFYLGMYAVSFLLLPKLIPELYSLSFGSVAIWLITSTIFTFIAEKFITRFGYFYPVAQFFYALAVTIFPCSAYGIEQGFPSIIAAIVTWIALDLIERIMLWIFVLIGFVTM